MFGRARAPVVVETGGYSYRSTVANMGNGHFVPFRRSHREAAGLIEGQPVEVTLTLDAAPRTIDPPDDLRAALEAVEGAKKPETRARRVAKCVAMMRG